MGRLIDADAFKRQIAEMTIANNYPANKANALCELVDAQPTAYDPDKVVEQLEEARQISASAKAEAIAGMCGASANYYCGAECAYERAIEIVKGGGVDA